MIWEYENNLFKFIVSDHYWFWNFDHSDILKLLLVQFTWTSAASVQVSHFSIEGLGVISFKISYYWAKNTDLETYF